MNIVLLCGSGAESSHTLTLLRFLQSRLEHKGVTALVWDLRSNPLPFALAERNDEPLAHPIKIVREFVHTMMKADAIVLGTPYYHGSYSGRLKNALDNLNKDSFKNKPVGLVSNGGSRSTNGLDHLRVIIRSLYGYTLQTQLSTNSDDYRKAEVGFELMSEDIKERAERFVDELLYLAKVLKGEQHE
jgi:azobenzene reductase